MATGISNTEKSIKRKAFAAQEIDRIELMEVEQAAYHDQGTCTFYGTANTNQLIAEAMGFQLPAIENPLPLLLTDWYWQCHKRCKCLDHGMQLARLP